MSATVLSFGTKSVLSSNNTEVGFITKARGADRVSEKVTITRMTRDNVQKTFTVTGSDGKTRVCRYDRLPDLEAARTLWREMKAAGEAGKEIQFVAAGGFDPARWFYAVR